MVLAFAGLASIAMEYKTILALINTSGRQRMLSQKALALEENMILVRNSVKADHLRHKLLDVAAQMEKSHTDLSWGLSKTGYFTNMNEVQRLFYNEPSSVDRRVLDFISSIRAFAGEPAMAMIQENVHHLHLHDSLDKEMLLVSLDAVVAGFQRAGERGIASMRNYMGIVFLLIIGTLALERAWLRGPFYTRMQEETERLNRTVEERTAELARAYRETKEEMAVRLKLEESLIGSERVLGMVIAHLPVIINVLDKGGIFILSEGRGLDALGKSPGKFVGESISNVYGGEDQIPEVYRKAFEGAAGHATAHQGGRMFYTRVEPLLGSNGAVTGVISVSMDITERVNAEKEALMAQKRLAHADKMKSLGALVAGVAHEINNPNSFIMMNVSLFERIWINAQEHIEHSLNPDDYLIPGEMRMSMASEAAPKLLKGIYSGSERIRDIVGRLKNYARQDFDSPKTDISLNDVLASALQFTGNILRASTSNLSLEFGEGLPLIYANSTEIEQVMVNLIMNACQALTDTNQAISICTYHDPGANMVMATVRDEGRGMPEEALEKATEPFFTTKMKGGGIGLGLWVSYNIIRETGGEMVFDSKEGEYTEVTIQLPALGATEKDQAL
ncbi:MAG: ATP-binding protein [Nitrospinota bacterium]|nr:ATP-binding protein [Nitrospinota bacterium]